MLRFSYPPYIENFAVEILGTIVRERFINGRRMKLAFLVLTSHDKCLNKKFTLNSQAGKVTLGTIIPSISLQDGVLTTT